LKSFVKYIDNAREKNYLNDFVASSFISHKSKIYSDNDNFFYKIFDDITILINKFIFLFY